MIIVNGNLFGEDDKFRTGDIVIAEGKVKAIVYHEKETGDSNPGGDNLWREVENNKSGEEIIDATGLYVIPGLVDIHLHGCNGYDFCDATKEALDAITRYQVENGVTSICPATMTLPRGELIDIFTSVAKYTNEAGSTIQGVTMEGPFLSGFRAGAQKGDYLQKPNVDFYRELQELSGNLIKQVAVAPEEDKDFSFVREVSKETVVSVAHTTASYELAVQAFEVGATHVTHLLNAMPEFLHRAPGVVGAAFDQANVYVEMICDGVHIHPSVVRAMFQLFGAKRICMISDSMRATGMPDGIYTLGGQEVLVKGRVAVLADKTIAGSVLTLFDCLKKAVLEMGIPIEEAIAACTSTPAKSLRLDGECGILALGRTADLVVFDKEFHIKAVIKEGRKI